MAIDLLHYTNLEDYFKIPDNINLAKNTRAKLFIQRCPNTNFFCNSFTIPDMALQPIEIATSSFKTINEPDSQYTISSLNFQLLIDEDFSAYMELVRWFRFAVTNGEVPDSYSNAIAIIFNSEQRPIISIKFYNMFPISIGEMTFNTSEDEPMSLQVMMNFLDIEIELIKTGERLFGDIDDSFFSRNSGQSFSRP